MTQETLNVEITASEVETQEPGNIEDDNTNDFENETEESEEDTEEETENEEETEEEN